MPNTSVDIIATPPVDVGPTRATKDSSGSPFDDHLQRARQPQGSDAPVNNNRARTTPDKKSDSVQAQQGSGNSASANASSSEASPADAGNAATADKPVTAENTAGSTGGVKTGPQKEKNKGGDKHAAIPLPADVAAAILPAGATAPEKSPTGLDPHGAVNEDVAKLPSVEGPTDRAPSKKSVRKADLLASGKASPTKTTADTEASAVTSSTPDKPTTSGQEEISPKPEKATADAKGQADASEIVAAGKGEAVANQGSTPDIVATAAAALPSPTVAKKVDALAAKETTRSPDHEGRVDGTRATGSKAAARTSTAAAETNSATATPTANNAPTANSTAASNSELLELNDALPAAGKSSAASETTSESQANSPTRSDAAASGSAADRLRPATSPPPRTESSGSTSTLSEVDRVRFVQRVSRAFQVAADRGGPLRLRLSPPELGSLRMEVSIKDGAMTARIEAQTSDAQSALLNNLPQLRERLAEQNIRIERFDVGLSSDLSGGQPQQDQSAPDRSNSNSTSNKTASQPSTTDASAAAQIRLGGGQLNVII